MDIRTATFPPGGYADGRMIYAFCFSDGSVYVGITGTSNNTGTSKPYERLATHLRKNGKTYSILVANRDLANRGFKFSYSTFPEYAAPLVPAVEQQCREILRECGVRLLNYAETHVVDIPDGHEEEVSLFARTFADHVKSMAP